MNRIKWFAAGIVTIATAVLLAQPPGAPGRSGGLGGSGRGRGGGGGFGGAGFVPNPSKSSTRRLPHYRPIWKPGGVLIYSKTNGFREEAAIQASNTALAAIAHERNWPYFVTENGAVMNKEQLAKFKVVVWNNNSGDTLNADQREAFKTWMENGGSYVGTHGAGGDPVYNPPNGRSSLADWPWYIETLVGAQFTSHSPQQFGDAHGGKITKSPLTKGEIAGNSPSVRRMVCFRDESAQYARLSHSDYGG